MIEVGEEYLRRGQVLMTRARLEVFMGDPRSAESAARDALTQFRAAMNWLEDTPEFEVAHYWLDEAGRWTRTTFGCWLTRDGTKYSRTCLADLAHARVGMSVGMKNVIRECSVCGEEPRTCRHIRGRTYVTTRRMIGHRCNVCGLESCAHVDGETGEALCTHLITSAELDEVSLVARPAQPMARIQSMSVSIEEIKAALAGSPWRPGMDVSCDRCLTPCGGVTDAFHLRTGSP
jgi:hypothetical protein